MIKIAICDDDEKELTRTKELCFSYSTRHKDVGIIIESFTCGVTLLEQLTTSGKSYDVLLLDIYMPEMTGIELASLLREKKDNSQIIFLTTSMNHAVEAFSLYATHYLVKPYTKEQLDHALNKAISVVEKIKKANILVKTSTGIQRVNLTDIIYSETEKHIQKIYLEEGETLSVRITCNELYDMLSWDSRFYKCGSTYIMNLDRIKEVTAKYILFETGDELPMQRRQYKELLNLYTQYLLERI